MPGYYYIICTLMLSLSLTGCFKKIQGERIDLQCDRLIKEALASHKAYKKSLDTETSEKVSNLIKAAKINQQHALFSGCVDKAYRAGILIGKKAPVQKTNKN